MIAEGDNDQVPFGQPSGISAAPSLAMANRRRRTADPEELARTLGIRRVPSIKPTSTLYLEAESFAKRNGFLGQLQNDNDIKAVALHRCTFDRRAADAAIAWPSTVNLKLVDNEFRGKPFFYLPWAAELVSRYYGWVQLSEATGKLQNRFRTFWAFLAKKNAKSPTLSAIILYELCKRGFDYQSMSYAIAYHQSQAQRVLDTAHKMRLESDLAYHVIPFASDTNYKMKGVRYGGSSTISMPSDADKLDGVTALNIYVDELHRMKNLNVVNSVQYATASTHGTMFCITTAGEAAEGGLETNPAYRLYRRCEMVNAGVIDDITFLGANYECPMGDEDNEQGWLDANPAMGNTPECPLKLETFRMEHAHARQEGGIVWDNFCRLRLNQWVQSRPESWLSTSIPGGYHAWSSSAFSAKNAIGKDDCSEAYTYQDLVDICQDGLGESSLAFDLSSTMDTTSFTMTVREFATDIYRTYTRFYLPEATAIREKKWHNYYQYGTVYLTLTPGNVIDYVTVQADIERCINDSDCKRFFYDHYLAESFSQGVELATQSQRYIFPQTYVGYAPAVRFAEMLIAQRKLRHPGDNWLLNGQIGTAKSISNTNAGKRIVKPSGSNSRLKVDGVQSLLMSLQPWVANLPPVPDDSDKDDSCAVI